MYLYSFRRCPYAIRARIALGYVGAKYEHREILLKDKPKSMLMLSPKGTVPVLVLDDGRVLDESMDIMRWALSQNDPDSWHERNDAALIAKCDGEFKHSLDRFKYSVRFPSEDALKHRNICEAYLLMLEQHLKAATFLSGEKQGLTDVAIFPFIRQFSGVDKVYFENLPIPKLHAWLQCHLESDLFKAVMHKHELWVE